MKLVLALALVAVAAAAPAKLDGLEKEEPIAIVRMESTSDEAGGFEYAYETANNIQAQVQGAQKQIGEEFGTVMSGSYSFTTPEGQEVRITWTADENGFVAEGDAIPKAPTE